MHTYNEKSKLVTIQSNGSEQIAYLGGTDDSLDALFSR